MLNKTNKRIMQKLNYNIYLCVYLEELSIKSYTITIIILLPLVLALTCKLGSFVLISFSFKFGKGLSQTILLTNDNKISNEKTWQLEKIRPNFVTKRLHK
jgi:hypothetical protein